MRRSGQIEGLGWRLAGNSLKTRLLSWSGIGQLEVIYTLDGEDLLLSRRLDDLVERLASEPSGLALANLEADVVRGIAARTLQARQVARLAPIGAASVGLALAIGIAAGGATAAATVAKNGDAFAVSSSLAPSTLLGE